MAKIIGFTAVALTVLAASAGCATEDDAMQGVDATEADLSATKWFDCRDGFSDNPDQMSHVEIGYSKSKLTVTDLSQDALPSATGTSDDDYHPTSPAYAGSVRYTGFEAIENEWSPTSVAFLVSKEIQDGKSAGKIWLRTQAPDGGGTSSLWCKAKSGPIKVKPAVKARLACSLTLLCQDDNPPGSTCLDSAFIQQTDAKTVKMRVQYLDHFGVHVQERKVELGSDDTIDRDTKSFKASVNGNTIDLKYRGGVTYTGELKLADGRKTKATCNDLAMLDD